MAPQKKNTNQTRHRVLTLALATAGFAVVVVATRSYLRDVGTDFAASDRQAIEPLRKIAHDPELKTLYGGCPMSEVVSLDNALEEHWQRENQLDELPRRLPETGRSVVGSGGAFRVVESKQPPMRLQMGPNRAIQLVSAESQEWLIPPEEWYSASEMEKAKTGQPESISAANEPLPPATEGRPAATVESLPPAPVVPIESTPSQVGVEPPRVAGQRADSGSASSQSPSSTVESEVRSDRSSAGTSADSGEWLIDPDGWYSEEEKRQLGGEPPSANGWPKPALSPSPTNEVMAEEPPAAADRETVSPKPAQPATVPQRTPDRAEGLPRSPSDAPVPPSSESPSEEIPLPPPNPLPPARDSGTTESDPDLSLFGDSAPGLEAPQRKRSLAGSSGGGDGPAKQKKASHVDPHLELISKNCYPSARECAKCHKKHYDEWSVSSHAYANISPMFQKFEQRITELSQGTVGYFCYRCHSPVLTQMGLSRTAPLGELPDVLSEGVTCIACHRVQTRYHRSNGDRRIETGSVFAPVLGNVGGTGVHEAISKKNKYKVKTSPDETGPGQDIHNEGYFFDQLSKSEFCATCHQVAVHPGIKLEVVYEQYRASPACKKGIECQHCHMGKIPGLPSGFTYGPIAEMSGKAVHLYRKQSNHVFYGPGNSIAHPGIFPFHLKAGRWTHQEWLQFDWRAGWGTDEFEKRVEQGYVQIGFPPVWSDAEDRRDARDIVDDNMKKMEWKNRTRKEVMENGSHLDGPFFDTSPRVGKPLKFHFIFTNTNSGHNLLTASLGAQPQLWANIVVVGPDGKRIWETGYLDSYGDVADIHSVDVRNGKLPFDWQLFNLQTMFLITGAKGTDRELPLPVNVDFDQLPFLRPGAIPISTTNHPPFIRMESRSLAALGSKHVKYKIPGKLLCQPGTYRMAIRMRNRVEPMYFMRFCNATIEMQRRMMESIIDHHEYSIEFTVR